MEAAQQADIRVHAVASETLHPLASYMKKAGAKGPPATMGGFQKLFGGMKLSKPLEAPDEFPPTCEDEGFYLPPKQAIDLPWPRDTPRSKVEPIWDASDCKNLTSLVNGGETLALKVLKDSLKDGAWVANFEKPKTSCTSLSPSTTNLSPYLSWGCVSPRTTWFAIAKALQGRNATKPPVSLHGQLLWRDFNHLMAHDANQEVPGCWNWMEGNKHCRQVSWDDDPRMLEAWKKGETGYPWIDACMRQLATEGWIHHLGRHAVACFLTRGDLWQSWEKGAQHFEATLLDADYSLNGFNWLWLSCSGFFYQYFRCYSPIAFQKKNDPNGNYIKKYVPELKNLPAKYIYEPWKAPTAILERAGVVLGDNYPEPIVEHATVSKANMGRMKEAYDAHKLKQEAMKKQRSSSPQKKKQRV